jgi:hypothetical protein
MDAFRSIPELPLEKDLDCLSRNQRGKLVFNAFVKTEYIGTRRLLLHLSASPKAALQRPTRSKPAS